MQWEWVTRHGLVIFYFATNVRYGNIRNTGNCYAPLKSKCFRQFVFLSFWQVPRDETPSNQLATQKSALLTGGGNISPKINGISISSCLRSKKLHSWPDFGYYLKKRKLLDVLIFQIFEIFPTFLVTAAGHRHPFMKNLRIIGQIRFFVSQRGSFFLSR